MPQAPAARPSRSLVWPLVALAVVGIAAGALFLVWKQMQQQPPPAVVNITSSDRVDAPARVVPVDAAELAVGSGELASPDPGPGSGSSTITVKRPPDKKLPPKGNRAYTALIQAARPGVNKCAQAHGAPPSGVQVEIIISLQGRPKTISLQPAAIISTPLGACIKNVLSQISFPAAPDEKRLSVNLIAS